MTPEEYKKEREIFLENSNDFWREKANSLLTWSKPFTVVHNGEFIKDDKWFSDGKLNACYNCIDRWVKTQPDKTALIFNDNSGNTEKYTYKESYNEIIKVSHVIKHIKAGECITVYATMSPMSVFIALACARLGIVHNFVFGGFSAESLNLRIINSNSKMLISQNFIMRSNKKIDFIPIIHDATKGLDIEVIIIDIPKNNLDSISSKGENFLSEKFISMDKIKYQIKKKWLLWSSIKHSNEHIDCVEVESEHPLFYLYTSGSTGVPKGLIHSTGGYLTFVTYTMKTAFDIKSDDIFLSTADIGWITGHSYSVYAPLSLGITSVIREGVFHYPSYYRIFKMIDEYKITHLYTAPTAIRILKYYLEQNISTMDLASYDISSLRLLGSVGEPLNSSAYLWFSKTFRNLHIVDTYFQTETGGILVASITGLIKRIPECTGYPIPGIEVEVISNSEGKLGKIYITKSWPGIARGILNHKEIFINTYSYSEEPSRGNKTFYFTGDEGIKKNGLVYIKGRADDVINISGHRISTSEVESVASSNDFVSEAAIVAIPHQIKGHTMVLFVVLKQESNSYEDDIKKSIALHLGKFCVPEFIVKCPGIPKTATGKLMRRVLRIIASNNKNLGNLTTCINPEIIPGIENSWKTALSSYKSI